MKITSILMATAFGVAATGASAATVSYSDSVSLSTTDWTETLQVSQFDTALGSLLSVMVTLTGGVTGDASGESLDAAPATITLDLGAEINASTTALGNIGTVLPVVSSSFDATIFDGTIDFGGTSGVAFLGVSASDSDSTTLTGADMASFIGGGTVGITLEAEGDADSSGAGNLITQFATQAQASVTVKYTFEEIPVSAVPLPAGAPLLLAGLGVLGFARRRS